jgi:UDPglucose 6-dehydrogenase
VGPAFKPRTDDIRDAPALALIDRILAAKGKVRAFDPEAMNNVKKQLGGKIEYCANAYDALKTADALIVATEWNEFRTPSWDRVKSLLSNPVIFDGRNIYRPELVREQGFTYYGIGKP